MTIKTKQTNPFQRPAVEHKVGGTYGERRLQSTIPLPIAGTQKTTDNFKPSNSNRQQVSNFSSNATFNNARRLGSNIAPYKKALHDRLENGALKKSPVKRPSDQAYLNYLAKVIDTPAAQKPGETRKIPTMGAPIQPSKTRQA